MYQLWKIARYRNAPKFRTDWHMLDILAITLHWNIRFKSYWYHWNLDFEIYDFLKASPNSTQIGTVFHFFVTVREWNRFENCSTFVWCFGVTFQRKVRFESSWYPWKIDSMTYDLLSFQNENLYQLGAFCVLGQIGQERVSFSNLSLYN